MGKERLDFLIITPTYNRAKFFGPIMLQLIKETNAFNFRTHHIVWDDASDWRKHNYGQMVEKYPYGIYTAEHQKNPTNFGREKFWMTWDAILKRAQKFKWDFCIAIPDDHELCREFIPRVLNAFKTERKRDKIACAMNILPLSKWSWHFNRYVDGAFICDERFFYALNWTVNRIGPDWFNTPNWRKSRPMSSGVGKQMSSRLAVHAKYRIAKVRNVSYLKPMECHSRMFPPEKYPRRPRKWGEDNFIDKEPQCDSDSLETGG